MAASGIVDKLTRRTTAPDAALRRLDVQGLRALAIGVVVLFHAGATWLPGGYVGVDIFFVISGFLITGILVRESDGSSKISLAEFYARRARRILPAAAVTLAATAGLTYAFLPRSRWEDSAREIMGSAGYVVNWMFASDSVDYLQRNQAPSVVQQFWSLAVEEQFYIVWPLLLLVVLGASRWWYGRGEHHTWVTWAVVSLTGASLAWSIYQTQSSPASSYFQTTTRLWELGVGAIAAVLAEPIHQRLNGAVPLVLGWMGMAGMLGSAVFFDDATPFPGYHALIPTLGAALVLVAGMTEAGRFSAGRLLALPPLVWVGDLSYSLYLWHWPLIIIATHKFAEGGSLRFSQGILVAAAALAIAWVSRSQIELRFQEARTFESPSQALPLGLVLSLSSLIAGLLLMTLPKPVAPPTALDVSDFTTTSQSGEAAPPLIGAELLAKDPKVGEVVDRVSAIQPEPAVGADDNPSVYADGCHQDEKEADVEHPCVYGDPAGRVRVVLTGDSHAAQWTTALQVLALDYGWRLEVYTKSQCPAADLPVVRLDATGRYQECEDWNSELLNRLTDERPDLVVTSTINPPPSIDGKPVYGEEGHRLLAEGLKRTWTRLKDADIRVASLVDTPRPGINVPECVETHRDRLSKCATSRSEATYEHGVAEIMAAADLAPTTKLAPGVTVLDLNAMICPTSRCAAVIGGVLVYRDENHLTATYSASLAGELLRRFKSADLLPTAAFEPAPDV